MRSWPSRMGFNLPPSPGSVPVSSGKMTAPPPGRTSRSRVRRPSAGSQSCRTRAEKLVAAANTVIGRWLECRSRAASPCSPVVARFQAPLGNSASTSAPASGSPARALRTPTTARAGLGSCGAAGTTRRTSASSITRYSGSLPHNPRVSRWMIGTPSPRRSMKYRLSSEPRIPPTGIRPSREVNVWVAGGPAACPCRPPSGCSAASRGTGSPGGLRTSTAGPGCRASNSHGAPPR